MTIDTKSRREAGLSPRIVAIVVAAGRGTRIAGTQESATPKQYIELAGVSILRRTVTALLDTGLVDAVLPVIHADDRALYDRAMGSDPEDERILPPAVGGRTRQESVLNGLEALFENAPEFVLIHDAARPFVTRDIVSDAAAKLEEGASALIAAVPVADTLKRVDGGMTVGATVDRNGIWAAQTPQSFRYSDVLYAHRKAADAGRGDFTDDAAVAEWAGMNVHVSTGSPGNTKITTPDDLVAAERRVLMEEWLKLGDIRVGTGYDVHAFEPGKAVILGGVEIPFERKLKGHSDADVVLHAITDAIFGALGDGDIGHHFPPSDPEWKGAASDKFLIFAIDRVAQQRGRIAHIDVTIVCEAPKIGPHRERMRRRIAEICSLPVSRVSVKATTSEQLGFTGRREGIAAMACATIRLPFDRAGEDNR
ncbi:bifunctional 2-C-methyl-D-erythritol 4-phosphate cytidylyltransferase/2-C-methyl-D-erythritol 2,4-cyclodiphosphate synthase [Rhizobiales bacterium]|uniref:bifunctional 2-C-methyl-D-erythritol 4-phosphate cytidylyltransferase/2-C-methyl-D-erythritol 2,4-cyclodiphosphate synthase n=1 Tax=Hongsoonwoonella zoysiae TaxID=2821844 RepID=UPI00155FB292|nr:bifunctional 2-C-methyl-D-erythritol 4-phosphate cytidylyltransferase/2-C-methyl-D-erythritol 2,4-cyclodiphosphate synthase [Hongsoonwoonella zoysiae]NRG18763.1 bifunctional 2-C-methyl-D-erythritol 4-phosphate cytidylyltransferase/2-C-methyl-D-erythritol 2,4-cyclodiphosphate synthase [Hongsoonwoonella zoysiae]